MLLGCMQECISAADVVDAAVLPTCGFCLQYFVFSELVSVLLFSDWLTRQTVSQVDKQESRLRAEKHEGLCKLEILIQVVQAKSVVLFCEGNYH